MNYFAAYLALGILITAEEHAAEMPHLQKNHGAWQLMVDGKPFLMRGGEFANNVYEVSKDLPGLPTMLDAYKSYDLNTLLVPISWRSLEPQEGMFDFRMIDTLIEECRKRDLRVVVLWFGAIKNGGLHYAPSWVIRDRERFFRAKWPTGKDTYAISPFCEAAWQADRRAFIKLLERIKQKDAGQYTVVMIQPENETGCQEIDESRDNCPAADKAWNAPVPEDLVKYLTAQDGHLVEWLQRVWTGAGKKASGTWPEIFGSGTDGQKIFMSYYIGRFIEQVASAGTAIYPLPMFINDWLGNLDSPGGPIGGPEFHVMEVFRVTAPSAFACVPDIYQDNFKAWVTAFDQKDNPILIPEAHSDARAAQQCWYTFFQHDGLLFSPYMLVPNESDQKTVPLHLTYSNLKMSYSAIAEMEDLILSKQGLRPRELACFELDKTDRPDASFPAEFQNYSVRAQATRGFGKLTGGTEDEPKETPGFAALMKMGENDFLVMGKTMRVSFHRSGYRLKSWEKGRFRDHQWVAEQPLDVPQDATEIVLSLTDAPRSLDLVRIRFEKSVERAKPSAARDDAPYPHCVKIFNGFNFDGWEADPSTWSVVDAGAMRGLGGTSRLAYTKADYGSFRLIFTARMNPVNGDHLGVLFWGDRPSDPSKPKIDNAGWIQFMPPFAGMWDYHPPKHHNLPHEKLAQGSNDSTKWCTTEILCNLEKGTMRAAVDGLELARYTHPTPAERQDPEKRIIPGPIGLFRHGGGASEYKDVYVEANPTDDVLITVKTRADLQR